MFSKAKILAPFFAVIYLIVCGSSMLCAADSVYLINRGPDRYYSKGSSSKQKDPVVWIINRHIVTPVKEKVSLHLTFDIPPQPVINEFQILLTAQPGDLFLSEYYSAAQGRAPPRSK